jgi:peroxiredoxin/glutaredoxin
MSDRVARAGMRVPCAELIELRHGLVEHVASTVLFDSRRVILFALPGAFTPTCSTAHVPGYVARLNDFRDTGIDDVICLAVNDPYVMNAWQRSERAQGIRFVADPEATFTCAMGMSVSYTEKGLGLRSRRYSMLIDDGTIESIFIEELRPDDPLEVSDADTMWRHWRPNQPGRGSAFMFARHGCAYCARAEELLQRHGIVHDAMYLGDELTMVGVRAATGATTLPQVFIEGKLIGGAEQLAEYLSERARALKA